MRAVVALVLLCVLAAAAAFALWSGDAEPAAPGAGGGAVSATPPVVSTESPDAPAPADGAPSQQRTELPPVAAPAVALASADHVACGRLLQLGRPLVGASVRVAADASATTDDDGRFVVALPGETATLEVTGATVPRGVHIGPVSLQGMRRRELGDLHVPPAVGVVGRVVDEQGGALANVRVYATRDAFAEGVDHDDPRADLSALSGQDGSFRIYGLRPGEVKVRAVLRGHGSQQPSVEVQRGVADVGLVVLMKRDDLTGTIVDAAGQPLAGAIVTPGGGSYALQTWAAVETDAAGRFTLVGGGKGWTLTIEKPGYARRDVDDVYALPRPLRIELADATPLRGCVHGLDGAAADFYVDTPEGDYRHTPSWVSALDYRPTPVAEDGTFSLPHLPAGKWVVRVRAPRRGSVDETPFEIPLAAPLELQLVPDVPIDVTVLDDDGQPVRGAELRRVDATYNEKAMENLRVLAGRWFDWPRGDAYEADERGRATVRAPAGKDVSIAVRAPMFLPTAVVFRADAVPAAHTVTLRRAGFVAGRIDDPTLRASVALFVNVRPVGEEKLGGASRLVDAAGGFRAGPLVPGDYELGVSFDDMTHFMDRKLPVPAPVPLIHGYDVAGWTTRVTIVAGEQAEVVVPAPKLGELRGRVLAGARPIAGAIVYAEEVEEEGGRRGLLGRERDGLDAHEYEPNCRTDELGRFRFLVGTTRTIRIRARRPTSGGWCAPIEQAVSPLSDLDLPDILLPSSTIRGQFDLTSIETKDRRLVEAQLYPITKAAGDPFYHGDWSTSLEWESQRQEIGVTGAFAFEGVQPGNWVLRIITGFNVVGLQREISIGPDDVVDLGRLQPPELVRPRLRSGLTSRHGAWLRRASGSSEAGVWVATLGAVTGPDSLPPLPPGSYLLQAFEHGPRYAGEWGITGRPAGEPVTFELHADGTTTPQVVWPDGL